MLKGGADEPWDEEYARISFTRYLNDALDLKDIVWEKHECPDYYLTIGDESFAVEVTHTKVLRDAPDSTAQVPEGTYEISHGRLVEQVEQAARAAGILRGVYLVRFQGPIGAPAQRFEAARSHVEREVTEYIRHTQDKGELPSTPIFYKGRAVCWIAKLSEEGSLLEEVFVDAAWTESPEFMDKVCRILQDAISRKRRSLEYEPRPKILLLLNTYPLAYASTYRGCLNRIESVGFFHSMFVVAAHHKVSLLYDRGEYWSGPDWENELRAPHTQASEPAAEADEAA